ncbi:MAG: ABC transporter substrate-binding protein [Bacteriovorax sp.]|nr:ABC transporter substrate-binding protein [Bacteriovorax sp.]
MKFILVFLLLLPVFVKAQSISNEAPVALIQNIFSLAQKENPLINSKTKSELDSHFDFHQMSLNILGNEAKKRTAADLKWFEDSIKEIITKTVYPKAPEFLKGVKITYKNTLIDGDKATVPSVVAKKGEKTDVSYKLVKSGSEWKVVDISIDEESWVNTINDKMTKTLKEKGWTGVKDMINKRVKALNTKA